MSVVGNRRTMTQREKKEHLKWINGFANAKTVTKSNKPKKKKEKHETNKK